MYWGNFRQGLVIGDRGAALRYLAEAVRHGIPVQRILATRELEEVQVMVHVDEDARGPEREGPCHPVPWSEECGHQGTQEHVVPNDVAHEDAHAKRVAPSWGGEGRPRNAPTASGPERFGVSAGVTF